MSFIRSRYTLFIILSALIVGCGGKGDRPDLARVTGKVTLDGEPLPKVDVIFGPVSGRSSSAVTNEKGEYTLEYMYKVPGAKIGQHYVSIKTHFDDDASPKAINNKEKIPAKYNTKTELKEEVKAGSNVINFDLKST